MFPSDTEDQESSQEAQDDLEYELPAIYKETTTHDIYHALVPTNVSNRFIAWCSMMSVLFELAPSDDPPVRQTNRNAGNFFSSWSLTLSNRSLVAGQQLFHTCISCRAR
ncbi:hypothetical protein BGZ73_002854 [Actinomortierella ambigua]|nr:hypothetical protein BGZ73_002854 [Actinomortierella ambigua]